MSWVVIACARSIDGSVMLSVNRGIWLDSVEMVEAGQQVDSKKRHQVAARRRGGNLHPPGAWPRLGLRSPDD